MNILDIQDKLKGLPDDYLARQLQQPTGEAPSYLVLSELKRRKDMRAASGQEAPKKQSMAEEAAAGIASLPVPPGMEPVARNAGAPPQGMYRGGPVRMAGGGPVHYQSGGQSRLPIWRGLPPSSVDPLEAARMELERTPMQRRSDPNFLRSLADQYGVPVDALAGAATSPPPMMQAPASPMGAAAQSMEPPPPRNNPADSEGFGQALPQAQQDEGALPTPPAFVPPPPAPAVGGRGGGGGGGAGLPALAGRSPVAAEAAASMQGPQEPDRMAALRDELRKYQEASTADRREAGAMGLMEAGLRIAGSNNPNFMGALGDAAPAITSYGRQMDAVKKGDRENYQNRLYLERFATDEEYRKGQIENQRAMVDLAERRDQRAEARAGQGPRESFQTQLLRELADPNTPEERRKQIQEALRGPMQDRSGQQDVVLAGRVAQAQSSDPFLKKWAEQLSTIDPKDTAQYGRIKQLYDDRYNEITRSIFGSAGRGSSVPDPFGIRR